MIYESVCPKCGRIHIYRQSMIDRDKAPKCSDPACGTQTIRKIITPPAGIVIGATAG